MTRAVLLLSLAPCLFLSVGARAAQSAGTAGSGELRLNEVLWHGVQNRQGEELGGVSDVLAQMPSGKLRYVAVMPSAYFERPKAVPPSALSPDQAGMMQLDISTERWRQAPRLDYAADTVIKNTEQGQRIYGYYQQAWLPPDPSRPWAMTIVARPQDGEPADRYVSLKKLLFNRVVTPAGQDVGIVRDFLLDWPAKRATHALVAPQYTPLATPDQSWFAIPVELLNPPVEQDAIEVNSPVEAFRRAPRGSKGKTPSGEAAIYRYPPPAGAGRE